MNQLINISDNQIFTSRDIAEWTGKMHKNVLRDIEDEMHKLGEIGELIFEPTYYVDNCNRKQHQFSLSKDGVMQIAARYDAIVRYKIIQKLKELSKPISKIDWLIESALQMKMIEERQAIQDAKIKQLEGKVKILNDKEFTIMGYANMNDILVTNKSANRLGRFASKLSRELGYDIGTASHPVYGRVNTYHLDILDKIFDEYDM